MKLTIKNKEHIIETIKGTYEYLLECFEQAGIELRPDIDEYFKKFK